MKRLVCASLCVVAALLGERSSKAWTPIDPSRPVWCGTINYGLNSAGSPDLGIDTSEAELLRATGDWGKVWCTKVGSQLSYTGRSTKRPVVGDGSSVVGWTESGWAHGSGVIGVTTPIWSGGCFREADMELNGVNYTWITTAGSGSRVNAYSIILHEYGHFLGLGHSSSSSATMYYAYSGGISKLSADDSTGICALYPGTPTTTDCTTTGCPAGQTCVSGKCQPVVGTGNPCTPCTSAATCKSGSQCLSYPDGKGYCGRNCTTPADCPAGGYDCLSIGGATNQCVRVIDGTPSCTAAPKPGCTISTDCPGGEYCVGGACKPIPADCGVGTTCATDGECPCGRCVGGKCSKPCDWTAGDGECGAGFVCEAGGALTCGGGTCAAGTRGAAAVGETCASSLSCAAGVCLDGRCSTPCRSGGADVCTGGQTCKPGALPGCGSCGNTLPTGDPCVINPDCASGICVGIDGVGHCADPCAEDGSCGSGKTCLDSVDGRRACADAGTGEPVKGSCGCATPGNTSTPDGWWLMACATVAAASFTRKRRARS